MKYGIDISIDRTYADARLLADLAMEAEQAGWDGFFVQDYLLNEQPVVDPWIALAAIAMRTERLRIGAFMTALPRRRPWKVARETVSLDHLSGGRLIFGAALGYGPREFTAVGEEGDARLRAEKLDEALEILAGLWTGESYKFEGKHYRLDQVTIRPRPAQSPRIPVWIAGSWPHRRPFRRAARWDGVYIMTHTAEGRPLVPKDIPDIISTIWRHRETAQPFEVAFAGVTPPDSGEAAEITRPFAEAGVTWWIEGIGDDPDLDKARQRIHSGPPLAE